MKQRTKFFLFVFVLNLIFISCKQNVSDSDKSVNDSIVVMEESESKTLEEIIEDESTEANYQNVSSAGTKRINSERFGFTFEIPEQWSAIDKSNNGDGYFIETDDKTADLRIYGENLKGNAVMAEMELEACESTEKFTFSNGYPGLKCFQGKDEYYYYDTPDTRVIFYVHASTNWKEKNKSNIQNIAKSIAVGYVQ